jgi:hypothetical protein
MAQLAGACEPHVPIQAGFAIHGVWEDAGHLQHEANFIVMRSRVLNTSEHISFSIGFRLPSSEPGPHPFPHRHSALMAVREPPQ